MALYTYSDFENEAKRLGHFDTLSKADISLAKSNPDAGMSLLKYVNDYSKETNVSKQKQLENSINQLRQNYGGYKIINGQLQLTNPTATNFNYVSPYADRIGTLTDAIANRKPFSFDAESDPSAMAARKAYLRDSKRATEDAIASASAMTGGIPSSYAVMAGTQAGDYHASQFADRVQALENAAYDRYLNENSLKQTELNSLLERDANEKNAAYTEHMNKVNSLGGNTVYSGSSYNNNYYAGSSVASGTGGSSIFDVLPKPTVSETKPSVPETPKTETPTAPDTGSGNTSPQLPSTQAPNVSLPNNYYDPYYSGFKVNNGSSVSNALPTPTVGEKEPSVPETPSAPTQNGTSAGNTSESGNDIASQLPEPSLSEKPQETSQPTTPEQPTSSSDLVSQAGGFSDAYSQLTKLGYSPISKATFDRMKQQGQADGLPVAGVVKYKTYDDYLNNLLSYAMK